MFSTPPFLDIFSSVYALEEHVDSVRMCASRKRSLMLETIIIRCTRRWSRKYFYEKKTCSRFELWMFLRIEIFLLSIVWLAGSYPRHLMSLFSMTVLFRLPSFFTGASRLKMFLSIRTECFAETSHRHLCCDRWSSFHRIRLLNFPTADLMNSKKIFECQVRWVKFKKFES